MNIRTLLVSICLSSTVVLFQSRADGQQGKGERPLASEAVQTHVLEVFNRNARKLEKDNPDVLGIVPDPGRGTIRIVTDRPAAVPTHIEDVPVTIKPAPPHLPPPPGVILLKPGGVQEAHPEMEECPQDYAREMRRYRWRFCQSTTGTTETIPAPMAPPIAGILFSEVRAIVERNRERLMALAGVTGVGIGAEGIHIETEQPELVPAVVEGLPTKPIMRQGQKWQSTNHTTTSGSGTTPFHGGVAGRVHTGPIIFTLGGVVLSHGKPWLVSAGHTITPVVPPTGNTSCPQPSCGLGTIVLNSCPHYSNSPLALWQQSPASNPQTVAYVSRWPSVFPSSNPNTYSSIFDVAAGFVDNDTIDGNGSLSVDRRLTGLPYGAVVKFSGVSMDPMVQDSLYIVSAIDSAQYPGTCSTVLANHVNAAQVSAVDFTQTSEIECYNEVSPFNVKRLHQVEYTTDYDVLDGTSGSLVLNQTGGAVVAVQDLGLVQCQNQSCTQYCPLNVGQGVLASYAKSFLGFDAWYGTDTVTDNTIGTFRPNSATWFVDNGNGKADPGCTGAAPIATRDQCFVYGWGTDVPITGDWDNAALGFPSNDFTVGVYRPTIDPTYFYLSNRNDALAINVQMAVGPSSFGYKPVSGKWRGNNGASNATTKVGVFRPGTGGWYLDSGNFFAEGCGTVYDYCFFLAAGMYQSGDTPIAGDWNNTGVVSVGLFRRGIGTAPDYFYLSNVDPYTVRNNGTISSWTYAIPGGPGNFGYLPVVGNWTGMGGSKLGVFQPSSGGWYLDNGNRVFASCAEDQCPAPFGIAGDKPVAFGKSLVKAN